MPPTRSSGAALLGADAAELERAATRLRDAADELDGQATALTALLRSVAWLGGVAIRFRSEWDGGHRARLVATSGSLRTAATALDRNAADQRTASSAGQTGGELGRPGGGATDGRAERLDVLLGDLGLGRRAIEVVVDHLELLDDRIAARVAELLASPGVAALVRGSDHVVDVAGVVLDVVADLGDHDGLPLDERLVHALADAAIRFGLQEGVEHGVELLTASVTAALIPGFGAALAPVISQASGVIAEQLFDDAIAVLDDETDVVDWCADRAVELYRMVMDGIGTLVEIGEAGVAIAGAAWDLAGDVDDWIDDRVADVGDLVRDLGGAAADELVDGAGAVGGFITEHVLGLG